METDAVDYSDEPFPDRVIFQNPSFVTGSPSAPPSPIIGPVYDHPSPVVSLPRLGSVSPFSGPPCDSPALDAPPLSPGTLQFLSSHTPPSLSFDPLSSSFFLDPSVNPPAPAPSHTPCAGSRPSGCFETPAVKVKPVKPIPQEGVPNPLFEHLSAPRTCKKKSKCIKATTRDTTIRFGEASILGDFAIMASTVLVGHVRGRAYSAKRLSQWVKEIWGGMLIDLPEVHVLPRG